MYVCMYFTRHFSAVWHLFLSNFTCSLWFACFSLRACWDDQCVPPRSLLRFRWRMCHARPSLLRGRACGRQLDPRVLDSMEWATGECGIRRLLLSWTLGWWHSLPGCFLLFLLPGGRDFSSFPLPRPFRRAFSTCSLWEQGPDLLKLPAKMNLSYFKLCVPSSLSHCQRKWPWYPAHNLWKIYLDQLIKQESILN